LSLPLKKKNNGVARSPPDSSLAVPILVVYQKKKEKKEKKGVPILLDPTSRTLRLFLAPGFWIAEPLQTFSWNCGTAPNLQKFDLCRPLRVLGAAEWYLGSKEGSACSDRSCDWFRDLGF
jgi:hypothetical protein